MARSLERPTDGADDRDDLAELERWFVRRGVPHFVESRTDGSFLDTWTRALPLLVAAYLGLGFNALDLADWSWLRNLGAAAAVIGMAIAAWALSNRLRHRPSFARPDDIDAPELALFVLAPALPATVFGQFGDAVETLLLALVILALIYVWASYGVGPLLRWAVRQSAGQFSALGPLVARALPLLLVFNTFLFINAEVWEVAGGLHGIAYVIVIATFVLLGTLFVTTRVPGLIQGLNTFESWAQVGELAASTPAARLALPAEGSPHDPLRARQKMNIGLVVLFGQAVQITLVAASLVVFFLGFGFFAIQESTITGWTGLTDLNVLADVSIGGRTLVITEPLVRVSVFLGAFSGMYFTVLLTTDDTYRSEFRDDVAPQIRSALAARCAYRVARGTHPAIAAPTDTRDPR